MLLEIREGSIYPLLSIYIFCGESEESCESENSPLPLDLRFFGANPLIFHVNKIYSRYLRGFEVCQHNQDPNEFLGMYHGS
ncbi:unnamed protein product [Rhizophagus irregularis]|uniref:Uncharacterized protein n=1 Tax=Rhizophagus irregularis TaxID=588596 RepID=A0A915ZEG5_9GLOM|nr:unnamed protein product [Rhizophagus irregularis]